MRKCLKCDNIIPSRAFINGKLKFFKDRKFCLDCSPYRKHKTTQEEKDLAYEKKKTKIKICLYAKGLRRKRDLIALKGGGCEKCGYNKCQRCLGFHHLDRESKLFSLCLNNLWAKSWDDILLESEKCNLLCANCHGEEEEKYSLKHQNYYRDLIQTLPKHLIP